jgi:hypothetical protein
MLADLQKLVVAVQADLRERSGELADVRKTLEREYERARQQLRTAQGFGAWREDFLAQVAVAWVLACVFVRYLEDNGLIAECWLAGPDNRRRDEARHRHQLYFRQHPRDSDREYLQHAFRTVGAIPAAGELFAEGKTPLWVVGPSGDMARAILAFWQDPARGALERTFAAPPGDTRFLGDLYQDLSEEVRKKYALLQTPAFVERFILDRTLTPALAEFGLEAVRLIDPTCGSGHFLLGAFERLFKEWQQRWQHTGDVRDTNRFALAQKALDQIYGVDINPYAVAIARFRLVVAAVHGCGLVRLKDAPAWTLHVHTGDSLYYGKRWTPATNAVNESLPMPALEGFVNYHGLEEVRAVNEALGQKYHVVVGNPPYITVKDAALSQTYRQRYRTCHRQYSLGVPFTERFFDLCLAPDDTDLFSDASPKRHGAGHVGMITANSFMKREFGKKLIEEFLPRIDLTHVIDTSGAFIPGHGTPTVILFGRNRKPVGDTVRAVLGIRSEPTAPDDPAEGLVWRSIVNNVDRLGSQAEFVSVTEVPRATFARHPWSIGGGGAAELKEAIEAEAGRSLLSVIADQGRMTHTGEDDAFYVSLDAATRLGWEPSTVPLITGEDVRDWSCSSQVATLFPYDHTTAAPIAVTSPAVQRHHWTQRTILRNRRDYGQYIEERGLRWVDHSMFFPARYRTPLSIAYAFVATHNQFALDCGGKAFNRSAPVIKLPADASKDEHLGLLGLLNSSTACFWMQQIFHNKGRPGAESAGADERWEFRFEHDSTKLQQFPLPAGRPLDLARQLDTLAREYADCLPDAVVRRGVPTRKDLAAACDRAHALRRQMIARQEELDWQCYHLYGLTEEALTFSDASQKRPAPERFCEASLNDGNAAGTGVPPLALGERAFEIVLARKVAAGEVQTAWFERHRSTPITDPPAHWPADYRALVENRLAAIASDPNIALIEQPEYKRRWNSEPWGDMEKRALRGWLLDRLETDRYWPRPDRGGEPLV